MLPRLANSFRALEADLMTGMNSGSLGPFAAQILDLWVRVLAEGQQEYYENDPFAEHLNEDRLVQLARKLEAQVATPQRALEIVGDLANELLLFLSHASEFFALTAEPSAMHWHEKMDVVEAQAAQVRTTAGILLQTIATGDEATRAAMTATSAADTARQAAGGAGEKSFGESFEKLGKEEISASRSLRIATFAGLILTFAIGALFLLESQRHELSWQELTLRAAMLVALGAVSGYAGRLAGQHRELGNWAKALAVQMTSFRALIEPITDEEVRIRMHEQLASRALEAPPTSKRGENETGLSGADIAAIITSAKQ